MTHRHAPWPCGNPCRWPEPLCSVCRSRLLEPRPLPSRPIVKRHAFDRRSLAAGERTVDTWTPDAPCEIVAVDLRDPQGPVDIDLVLVGCDILVAFRRRRTIVLPTQAVRVFLTNHGHEPGQATAEIHYSPPTG